MTDPSTPPRCTRVRSGQETEDGTFASLRTGDRGKRCQVGRLKVLLAGEGVAVRL